MTQTRNSNKREETGKFWKLAEPEVVFKKVIQVKKKEQAEEIQSQWEEAAGICDQARLVGTQSEDGIKTHVTH